MQMQCWEEAPTTTQIQRELSTDVAVAMTEPWAAVREAAVQRMLGSRTSISTGTGAE